MLTHNKPWFLLVLFTIWLPLSCVAELPIDEYKAEYKLYWHGLRVGTSQHEISYMGNHQYKVTAVNKPILPFVPFSSHEESRFQYAPKHIQPIEYKFDILKKGHRQKGHYQFDITNRKILSKPDLKAIYENISPKIQDTLTHAFQLREDIIATKTALNYAIAKNNKLTTYSFSIKGKVKLETAIGPCQAIQLQHVSPNKKRKTTIWLSEDHDYLMVKMQQHKKNKLSAEAYISQYEKPELPNKIAANDAYSD